MIDVIKRFYYKYFLNSDSKISHSVILLLVLIGKTTL